MSTPLPSSITPPTSARPFSHQYSLLNANDSYWVRQSCYMPTTAGNIVPRCSPGNWFHGSICAESICALCFFAAPLWFAAATEIRWKRPDLLPAELASEGAVLLLEWQRSELVRTREAFSAAAARRPRVLLHSRQLPHLAKANTVWPHLITAQVQC